MAGKIKRVTVFGYKAGRTPLHRMPAGLKLVFVILISALAFVSVYGLAASILLILICCAFARIPPHELLRGSKPLVILSLCVIVLKSITMEGEGIATPEMYLFKMYIQSIYIPYISAKGFFGSLPGAAGLFVPFAAASLLFSVTTMRELRLSLALVEMNVIRFFSRGRGREEFNHGGHGGHGGGKRKEGHVPFFSLGLSLMLGFMPRFFEMWDEANLACDSRSCKRGLRRLLLLLPLVTERMMEASANTALALEARGLTKEK